MRIVSVLALSLALVACRKPVDTDTTDTADSPVDSDSDAPVDADGDGADASTDCDDDDNTAFPGATEACDGVDNDCDGAVDEDVTSRFYVDVDADGYGVGDAVEACVAPAGHAAVDGDCDDADAAFHPGATEDDCADPNDYNCDGSVGYVDADADGHAACEDCADDDAAVNPGATETAYNGKDDDCDPLTPDDDLDGDGFLAATDCDDTNAAIHPDAAEIWYDGVDQDCDGANDNDQDGDGYVRADDCDDTNAAVNPGAEEIWYDGVDQACDGGDDDDQDGDGLRSRAEADGPDCDDTNGAIGPCADTPETATPSCAALHAESPGLPSGVVWVKPVSWAGEAFEAYCDMETAGGGWTLISNRRADTLNVEACGENLAAFFEAGCGTPDLIGPSDSFALPATLRVAIPRTEMLVMQYLAEIPEEDDAFIVHHAGADLFPNDTVEVLNLPVEKVCDLDNLVCDDTDVFWKYTGDSWFHNSRCMASRNGSLSYRGNYGICPDGAANLGDVQTYPSNGFTGDRADYNETKLWGLPAPSGAYQERIFVR